MDSVLSQLYRCCFCPSQAEDCTGPHLQRRQAEFRQKNAAFLSKLSAYDPTLPDELLCILEDVFQENIYERSDMFDYGISVGTRLMIEILTYE